MQNSSYPTPVSTDTLIWKQGIRYGVVLGIAYFILSHEAMGWAIIPANMLFFLGVIFFLARYVSRKSGKISIGVLASMVAGGIGGLIPVAWIIFQIIISGARISNYSQHTTQSLFPTLDQMASAYGTGFLIGLFLSIGIEIALAAGIGALGGLLGKHQSYINTWKN